MKPFDISEGFTYPFRVGSNTRHIFRAFVPLLVVLSVFLHRPGASSEKTLALLPLTIYADPSKAYLRQGVKSVLLSRLSGEGLNLVGDEQLNPLLTEKDREGITSEERAAELARGLNADFALFGSITSIGTGYSVDLSLLETGEEGRRVRKVSKAVTEDQLIPTLSDVAYNVRDLIAGRELPVERKVAEPVTRAAEPDAAKGLLSRLDKEDEGPAAAEKGLFFKPTKRYQSFEPTGKVAVSLSVMAFDTGDLDGDGSPELVVAGREKLLIYQRQGESFVLKGTLDAGLSESFLKVSVGDADGNGRAEIYLASLYGVSIRSTVLEWKGKFTQLDRRGGHLQVIKDSGGGKDVVLFLESKVGAWFGGGFYAMDWKEGKLSQGDALVRPKGIQFYTITRSDLNQDGAPEWLGLGAVDLSEFARLYVWDRSGEVLWEGDEKLGGTNNVIHQSGNAEFGQSGTSSSGPRVSFNSKPAVIDLDGDGKKEVLVVKNTPIVGGLRTFKIFDKATLKGYRVEGASLVPTWESREMDFCVTDIQAMDGTLFLAAQKEKIVNIGRESGRIYWFQ